MTHTAILYIGKNEPINHVMHRLINGHDSWQGYIADSIEEAMKMFRQHHINVVLLGNGLSEQEEQELRTTFTSQQPNIIIIQHYGGGSGLLENEIREALDKQ